MKTLKISIIFFLIAIQGTAQSNNFNQVEDSIQSLFAKIILTKNDDEKLNYNKQIENNLAQALSKKSSYEYPFSKLQYVSKLASDDGKVRIFTWNIPFNDGTFQYFGFIQLKAKNNILLVKLIDKSIEIEKPQQSVLNSTNWYGTLYYKILTNTYKNKTYYTLLGWDGNDNFTNKKIIELLTIKRKKPQFGAAVFKMKNKTQTRVIFEYAKQAKMMLSFDEKLQLIVFDHLAPSLKKFEDQYMYYGPDLSQDGFVFIDGSWVLKENIDLRNENDKTDKKPIKTSF